MNTYTVHLIGGDKDECATITTDSRSSCCHLTVRYRDKVLKAEAPDFFEAFCRVRLQLESAGLIPFCYGASLNVYPSGMARDMGLGLKAYRLRIGQHSSRNDLVEIFDEGPDVIPASVELQKQYYERWADSPKPDWTE